MSEVAVNKNESKSKGRFQGSKSEFLGKEPIGKLLWKMSYPAVIGMIVMTLYNLVDTIFIGFKVGALGIAGMSVVLPIDMISMSFALAIGIGSASIISRSMGQKNIKKTENVLGNFFSLALIIGILLIVIAFIFKIQILTLFGGASDAIPYAAEYFSITLFDMLFMILAIGGNNIVRAFGNSKLAMIIMVSSALFNASLDAILMYGFDMGMSGAAIATLSAFALSSVIVIAYFMRKNEHIKLHYKNLKLKISIVKEIFGIGASSFARQFSMGIFGVILNNMLVIYSGVMALAAFGIINKVILLGIMPLFGMIQGMQPIIGYNYGAKKINRVKKTVMMSIKISTLFAVIIFVLLMLFPNFFAGMFTKDAELLKLTSKTLMIVILALPVVGVQIVVGGYFQSIGKALPAFTLSLLRQVILLIPLIIILPKFFGYTGIIYAFPVSDLTAFLISLVLFVPAIKNLNLGRINKT